MHATDRPQVDGRHVGRVGIGGARWSICDPEGDGAAEAILEAAVAAGIRYVDTARAYTRRGVEHHNERLIARVLAQSKQSDVLVATKGGHFRAGDEYGIDGSAEALRADCERSRQALGVESIDLYYLHFPDPAVPFTDSVRTLHSLREEGMIRAVGLCNVNLAQVHTAAAITRIDAVQNRLSPFTRPDTELLRDCEHRGATFFAASPLGGTASPRELAEVSPTATRESHARGETIKTIMLAWMLTLSPHLALITGARTRTSLRSSLRAQAIDLDNATSDAISDELEQAWTS